MQIPQTSHLGPSFPSTFSAAGKLQRSCRRSERRTHLIGGVTSVQKVSYLLFQYFSDGISLAHTSISSWDPGESWFSIFICARENIPPIFYLFFSRCSLFFFASRSAAAKRRRPRGSMFWFTSYLASFHLNLLYQAFCDWKSISKVFLKESRSSLQKLL